MIGYNPLSKESIYEYAKGLKGKTFREICDEDTYFLSEMVQETTEKDYQEAYENKSRKGGLGEIVEERYFHYKADNEARADFPEAGVELKVTPYRINRNKSTSAKERVIISMINYMNIVHMDFYTSNAWEKLENMLLVYYLWSPEVKDRLDYIINFIYMLTPEGEDLKIIEKDFCFIRDKIMNGKAHELSEGDTLYLGAATKSSGSSARTPQPFSHILAKPRAFSLKTSYMTYVLRNYILGDSKKEDKIIKEKDVDNFEAYVLNKINTYQNQKDEDLFKLFLGASKLKSKNRYSRLALEILGVKTDNAEEFEKANIIVKSLRVEENNKITESISFPYFKALELAKQEWEDSDVFQHFSETKFLFIIYKKRNENYYLKDVKFWNMPMSDIEGDLKIEWERARDIFRQGVEFKIQRGGAFIRNNLPKKSNTNILHVRPHAQKAAHRIGNIEYGSGVLERDADLLPCGNYMTKQSFWLNNDYILEQIQEKLK